MKKYALLSTAIAAALLVTPAFAQDEDDDEEEAPRPAPAPKMIVAVDKFEDKLPQGQANLAAVANLRDRVTHYIVASRKFEVVERERIKSILSERMAAQNGLVREDGLSDEEQADKLENQKLKMAGYVVYGSVLSLGDEKAGAREGGVDVQSSSAKVEIELRISNAENGKILASKTVSARRSKALIKSSSAELASNASMQVLDAAVDAAALQCVDSLLELSFPPKVLFVDDDEVTINLPRELVHMDELFDVIKLGKKTVDEDTGNVYQKEKRIGRVKITDFTPTTCTAIPAPSKGTKGKKLDLEDVESGMRVRRVDPERLAKEIRDENVGNATNFETRF